VELRLVRPTARRRRHPAHGRSRGNQARPPRACVRPCSADHATLDDLRPPVVEHHHPRPGRGQSTRVGSFILIPADARVHVLLQLRIPAWNYTKTKHGARDGTHMPRGAWSPTTNRGLALSCRCRVSTVQVRTTAAWRMARLRLGLSARPPVQRCTVLSSGNLGFVPPKSRAPDVVFFTGTDTRTLLQDV
jgi:hypothetical protein